MKGFCLFRVSVYLVLLGYQTFRVCSPIVATEGVGPGLKLRAGPLEAMVAVSETLVSESHHRSHQLPHHLQEWIRVRV